MRRGGSPRFGFMVPQAVFRSFSARPFIGGFRPLVDASPTLARWTRQRRDAGGVGPEPSLPGCVSRLCAGVERFFWSSSFPGLGAAVPPGRNTYRPSMARTPRHGRAGSRAGPKLTRRGIASERQARRRFRSQPLSFGVPRRPCGVGRSGSSWPSASLLASLGILESPGRRQTPFHLLRRVLLSAPGSPEVLGRAPLPGRGPRPRGSP